MREDIVEALVSLRSLRVIADPDEEFDRLELMGEFARLLAARDELGEALLRYNRAVHSPAREA